MASFWHFLFLNCISGNKKSPIEIGPVLNFYLFLITFIEKYKNSNAEWYLSEFL